MPQQNHQAVGFQQGQIQPGFQNQGLVNQPINLGQQIGGQMVNPMFHADRAPQRYIGAHQQGPDPQPPHRQDADAYWADKITEVMRDQFGIKPKVNTYCYRTPYPPAYDLIHFQIGTRYQISLSFLDRMIHRLWNMLIGLSSNVEKLLTEMSYGFICSHHLCLDRLLLVLFRYLPTQ